MRDSDKSAAALRCRFRTNPPIARAGARRGRPRGHPGKDQPVEVGAVAHAAGPVKAIKNINRTLGVGKRDPGAGLRRWVAGLVSSALMRRARPSAAAQGRAGASGIGWAPIPPLAWPRPDPERHRLKRGSGSRLVFCRGLHASGRSALRRSRDRGEFLGGTLARGGCWGIHAAHVVVRHRTARNLFARRAQFGDCGADDGEPGAAGRGGAAEGPAAAADLGATACASPAPSPSRLCPISSGRPPPRPDRIPSPGDLPR